MSSNLFLYGLLSNNIFITNIIGSSKHNIVTYSAKVDNYALAYFKVGKNFVTAAVPRDKEELWGCVWAFSEPAYEKMQSYLEKYYDLKQIGSSLVPVAKDSLRPALPDSIFEYISFVHLPDIIKPFRINQARTTTQSLIREMKKKCVSQSTNQEASV